MLRIREFAVFTLPLVLAFQALVGAAQEPGLITTQDLGPDNTHLLSDKAIAYQDPDNTLTMARAYQQFQAYLNNTDSEWRPFATDPPSRIGTAVTLWAAVRIRNDGPKHLTLYYRNTHYSLRDATLYVWRDGLLSEQQLYGNLNPIVDNGVHYHLFTYPLEVEPSETLDLLLSIRNSNFPAHSIERGLLLTERELALNENTFLLFTWFLTGALFLLGILSLFAAINLHSSQFALLSLISINSVLMQLDFLGYLGYFLWPNNPFLKTHSLIVFSLVLMVSITLFIDQFLGLAKSSPLMHKVVLAGASIITLLGVTGFFVANGSYLLLVVSTWIWQALTLALVVTAFILWRNGYRAAKNLLIALAVTAGIHIMSAVGYSFFSYMHNLNMIFVSFPIVVIVLSLFMSAFIELRHQQDERDRAVAENKAKSDFLARMSHEIRTPMNGVIGMAEILSDTELSRKQRDYVNVIYNSGRTLLTVINEILDFSKIAAGKMELDWRDTDVPQAVQESVGLFYAQADDKQLELRCNIDPDLDEIWVCDETRLRQVILNLVGNAIKFTDRGKITVNLTELKNDAGIHITVEDTGIGISDQQLKHLFESFSQADVSTSRQYGGTGLGLAICKELTELMGGTIKVESTPGVGSAFIIDLPLKRGEASASESFKLSGSVEQPDTLSLAHPSDKSLHILAVEDNLVNFKVVSMMLEKYGHLVYHAENGASAIRHFIDHQIHGQQPRYDLILMDCEMPGMDGFETTEKIRALEAANGLAPTVIVALTAHVMADVIQHCNRAGMDSYLSKPVQMDVLTQILNQLFPDSPATNERPSS